MLLINEFEKQLIQNFAFFSNYDENAILQKFLCINKFYCRLKIIIISDIRYNNFSEFFNELILI